MRLWFSPTSISLINWELPFFLRFPFGHLLSALLAARFAAFRSRAALQLEILALRHQLGVLQRSVKRPKLTPADRLLWAWLCAVWNDWQSGVRIVKASTVIGWHRKALSSSVCISRNCSLIASERTSSSRRINQY